MIGHEQTETAMPDKPVVIMRHRGQHTVANASLTQLISSRRRAFDGDEKQTAFGHPLRNFVWQLFTDRQIHELMVANLRKKQSARTRVGRVSPLPAERPNAKTGAHGVTRPTKSAIRMPQGQRGAGLAQ